jgi:DNA-binding NtrC family response regulator
MRIVVVDDDAALLKLIERQLTFRGAHVVAHGSPFGLSTVLLSHHPTVVVLDVTMPGLDGGKLWELGRDVVTPRPGVIFYSALGPAPLAALTSRFPEAEGLTKPATSDVLWAAVERAHLRASGERP